MFSQHYKYQQKSKCISVLSYFKLRLLLTLSMWDEKFLACNSDPGGISLERFHDLQNLSFVFMDWSPLYSRIDLFPRPITIVGRIVGRGSSTTTRISPVVAATVSRESSWESSEIMLGSFRMWISSLRRDLLLLYFYSFNHDHYFMLYFEDTCRISSIFPRKPNMCWEVLVTP